MTAHEARAPRAAHAPSSAASNAARRPAEEPAALAQEALQGCRLGRRRAGDGDERAGRPCPRRSGGGVLALNFIWLLRGDEGRGRCLSLRLLLLPGDVRSPLLIGEVLHEITLFNCSCKCLLVGVVSVF